MYTQCPDCHTAFRVTADALKQAAGKVRCGGCGNAFSALEFLSESMPGPNSRAPASGEPPELKPESQTAGDLPGPVSPEQSAALLKTLDEFAGTDVRIEDTGIEWRVLPEDEFGVAADDDIAVDVEVEDQPGMSEIFESSPTPVDQILASAPPEVDSPEIFAAESDEPAPQPDGELRFDDNTPLPDNFGVDDEPTVVPVPASAPRQVPPHAEAAPEPQADLDLAQPGEWEDLLGEFENIAGELAEPANADAAAPDSVTDNLDALLEEAADEVRHLDSLLEDSRVDEVDIPEERAAQSRPESDAANVDEMATAADESGQLELIETGDDEAAAVLAQEDTEKLASTDTHALDEDVYGLGSVDDAEEEVPAEPPETAAEILQEDPGTIFESIVMEGEKISLGDDDDDDEKFAADHKAAATSLANAAKAQLEARENVARAHRRRYGLAAGVVLLGVLLAGQYLHQARNSLATIPAVNDVLGPVYRALGKPLFPEWDVTGWRFETTRHDAGGGDNNLAIASRVGNVSGTALPYPIIAVSLSDRFEEPLGSVTLDPSEYLAEDLDPRHLVDPGSTFDAAILITGVPANTTSFRLRVCYRAATGQLRCKEDGFL